MPERKKTTERPAREVALKLLTRREHSARELKRKLEARGIDGGAADAAIEQLAGHDLQSDARYAEQLLRTRIAQGYGPRRVRAELEQAGLDRDAVAEALAGCDWNEAACKAVARKYRGADNTRDARRQRQFLYARGFEPRQIDAATDGEDS